MNEQMITDKKPATKAEADEAYAKAEAATQYREVKRTPGEWREYPEPKGRFRGTWTVIYMPQEAV